MCVSEIMGVKEAYAQMPTTTPNPSADDFVRFFSAKQLGELLSVTPETVIKWSRAGRLPAPVWINKRPRWSEVAVRAALDALQPKGAAS
jgi:hypothetical protein